MTIAERPVSLWLADGAAREWPRLEADLRVEVAVVGAGIVGVSAARRLARAGVDVALVEAAAVGSGVSGNTTAKLSSLHRLTYAKLRRSH